MGEEFPAAKIAHAKMINGLKTKNGEIETGEQALNVAIETTAPYLGAPKRRYVLRNREMPLYLNTGYMVLL